MTLILKLIASAAISAVVLLGGIYYGKQNTQPTQTQSFGSFQPVQAAQFTLAGAGITNSQNTIQLASFALPDPNKTPITMAMFGAIGYGVLDPQTSKIENVSFTGVTQNSNGSATLTGVSRGLSFYTPYAASTTLAVSHAGGSTFILSNSGAFYGQQFTFTNNANTFSAVNTFGSTTPPKYDADPVWANFTTQVFADVSYVNSVVAAGCANAATGIKGCVQIATGLQAASSTGTGSTGALLVLPASIATDTPNAGTNTSKVLMSDLTGHLKQGWLDLTQYFSFSNIQSASSTFTGTTRVNGSFNLLSAVTSGVASSSPLMVDSLGNVTANLAKVGSIINTSGTTLTTANTSSTTITTIVLPAGVMSSVSALQGRLLLMNPGSAACSYELRLGTGSATTSLFSITLVSSSRIGFYNFGGYATSTTSGVFMTMGPDSSSGGASYPGVGSTVLNQSASFGGYTLSGVMYLDIIGRAVSGGICNVEGLTVQSVVN